jgi:hypothetical protein
MQDFYNRKIMKACGLTSLPDSRTFDIRLSTLENRYIQIHPSFDKLITSLRSAWAKDVVLDKEVTSHDDILDAFRLALRAFKEQSALQ